MPEQAVLPQPASIVRVRAREDVDYFAAQSLWPGSMIAGLRPGQVGDIAIQCHGQQSTMALFLDDATEVFDSLQSYLVQAFVVIDDGSTPIRITEYTDIALSLVGLRWDGDRLEREVRPSIRFAQLLKIAVIL